MQFSPRSLPAQSRTTPRRCSVAARAVASPLPVCSPNHYEVLGVSYAATSRELKQAFRTKSKEVHPDVLKAEHAPELFMRTKMAYETLSCEDARRSYDDALAFARLSALSSGPLGSQMPIVHSSYSSTGYSSYSSPYTTTSSTASAASAETADGYVSCSDSDPYAEECYADMAAASAAAAATPSYTYMCTSASAPSSSYTSTSRATSSARAAAGAAATPASAHASAAATSASSSQPQAAASNSTAAPRANARTNSPAALRNTMAALLKEARFWSRRVERTLGGAGGHATAAASASAASKAPVSAATATASSASATASPTGAARSRPAVFKTVPRSEADYDVGEAAAWLYYAPAGRAASLAMAAKAARNSGSTSPPLSPLRRRY